MTTKLTFGLLLSLGVATTAFAQTGRVGVNTDTPAATLDVVGQPAVTTALDGVIAPRLTGAQLQAKTYTALQTGATVYVTAADPAPAGQTINVTSAGQYYFDGTVWQKVANPVAGVDNTDDGWVKDPTNARTVLGFNSTGTLRAAGNEFVALDNGNVGIGTAAPTEKFHLKGSYNQEYYNVAGDIYQSYMGNNHPFLPGTDLLIAGYGSAAALAGTGGPVAVTTTTKDFIASTIDVNYGSATTGSRAGSLMNSTSNDPQYLLFVENRSLEQSARLYLDGFTGVGAAEPAFTLNAKDDINNNAAEITATTRKGIRFGFNAAGTAGEYVFPRTSGTAGQTFINDGLGNLSWGTPGAAGTDLTDDEWVNNTTDTRIELGKQSDGTTNRPAGTEFVATDAGNVGIGTNDPTSKLQVVGLPTFTTVALAQSSSMTIGAFYRITTGTADAQSMVRVKY